MASEANVWPSAPIVVSDRVKQLITRFFNISDSADVTSGRLFAEEVFTSDGVFKTHETCVFRGRDEIAASREKNHPAIASRSHQFSRIYAANSPATDLVVLGSFTIGLKGGNSVTLDFTARFVVAAGQGGEEDKFQYVQVWTDPTEMKAAFRKAEETLAKKG